MRTKPLHFHMRLQGDRTADLLDDSHEAPDSTAGDARILACQATDLTMLCGLQQRTDKDIMTALCEQTTEKADGVKDTVSKIKKQ